MCSNQHMVGYSCKKTLTKNYLCPHFSLKLKLTNGFFPQTHVSGGVIKNISVSIISVTFILDAYRFT